MINLGPPIFLSRAALAPAPGGAGTTWNTSDAASGYTFASANATAIGPSGGSFANVRSTTSKSSGKWYFEIAMTIADSGDNTSAGVANASASLNAYLGSDSNAHGFFSTGFYAGGSGPTYTNSIIGIHLDADNGLVYYSVDGTLIGTDNPTAGTGGHSIVGGPYFAAFGTAGVADSGNLRTTSGLLTYTPASGYSAWN